MVFNYPSYSSATYSFEAIQNVDPTTAMTLGKEYTGTLVNVGDEASYTFTGTAGQTIWFDGREATSGIYAELTDPYGNNVFNQYMGYDDGPFTLSQAGTYTLTVYGSSNAYTGGYDFVLDDTSTATSVTPGTVVTGTLASGLATNLYQFSGTAGQSVYFESIANSPTTSAYAYVYSPGNGNLTNFYLDGSGYDTTAKLPYTGTYIVAVAGLTQPTPAPTYSFEVYDTVNPTSTLTLGTEVSGTIANPGDSHTYTFTGSAGQRIYYDGLASANTYIFADLTDPYGNSFFDTSSSSDEGPYTLTYSGTYSLTISSYSNERATGAYAFTLDDTSTAPTIALTAGSGTTETGTLATGLTTNLYQFSGTAGQSLYFEGQKDSPTDSSIAYLYGPGNNFITDFFLESDATEKLPSTGTYILAVRGQSASNPSVNYQFEVFDNVNPTSALTLGTEVTGTIVNPGDSATYTFTGTAGQRLYYNALAASSTYVFAELTGPYGTNFFNTSASANEGPYTLTYSGPYTLTIYSYYIERATGPYAFDLEDAANATTIALTPGSGTTETGKLATGLTTNLYQFSGTAGQSLYFQGQQDSPTYAALAVLYNPGNSYVTEFYVENDLALKLSSTGPYILAVVGQSATNPSVNYKFEVFDNVNPTSALTLGTEVTGTIANPGDSHTYTFTGTAGQRLYYSALAVSSYYLFAELTDPYGNTHFDTSASSNEPPWTLAYSGTYTLTIYSYGNEGATGPYAFTLYDTATGTNIALTPGSGTTESGTLATGLATNLYQFSGTAGQSIYFQGLLDSPADGAIAYLYGPTNGYLAYFYLDSGSTAQETLTASGTYILAVIGQSASNPSVSYSFEAFDNVDTTSPLTLGTAVSGTLTNPGDEATYTFTGAAGQTLFYDGLSASSNIDVLLVNPSGSQILDIGASSDYGPFTLTQPGIYKLTIYGYAASTGNYDFRVLNTSAQTLTPTSTPTTVSGTITPGTGANIYQIAGTAGEQITLTSDSFSSTLGNWYLINPNNDEVTGAGFGSSFSATLPLNGPYVLELLGSDSTDPSVTYKFAISATTPASVTPSGFGTVQSGTLAAAPRPASRSTLRPEHRSTSTT